MTYYYRKPFVGILFILVFVFSGFCKTETNPDIYNKIKKEVISMRYSESTAKKFADFVLSWKDTEGNPEILSWCNRMDSSKILFDRNKIDIHGYSVAVQFVAIEMCNRLYNELSYNEGCYELDSILIHKKSNCFGYTQIVSIIGSQLGMSVGALDVLRDYYDFEPKLTGHIANIVTLPDSCCLIIDLTQSQQDIVSNEFVWKEEYFKKGNYWFLRHENQYKFYRQVRILNKNELLAVLLYSRGMIQQELYNNNESILLCTEALQLYPESAEIYCTLGNAYFELKYIDLAILNFNKAIELNPEFLNAYICRGNAYDKLGQDSLAISDYNQAIRLNPYEAVGYIARGDTYAKTNDTLALSDYTRATWVNSNFFVAYYKKGITETKFEKYDKAIEDLTKSISLSPGHPEIYCKRGLVYYILEDTAKACEDWRKAMELGLNEAKEYLDKNCK